MGTPQQALHPPYVFRADASRPALRTPYSLSGGGPLSFLPTVTDSTTLIDSGVLNGTNWANPLALIKKPVPAFYPTIRGANVTAHSSAISANQEATVPILVGPLKDGYEKKYADDTPMFIFKENTNAFNPVHLVAPPAVINFWSEDAFRANLSNITRNPQAKRRMGLGYDSEYHGQNKAVIPSIGYDPTVPTHNESFDRKYAFHGIQRNVMARSHYLDGRKEEGSRQLMINYNHKGDQKCVNMFTTRPKNNHYVYFVALKGPSAVSSFFNPNGGRLDNATEGSFLQIRGFSSSDSAGCLISDSTDDPRRQVPDFVDPNHILSRERFQLEIDESDGRVYQREMEMVDIPDIVVDAYRTGPVYRVGMIHRTLGASITQEQYNAAHATIDAMNSLPKMDLLLSL